MSSDYALKQDVLEELDFEPSVDAAHIGVNVSGGVVTLTGFVSSYAEKLAAERAARRVKGVKAIAEEIEVRLPSDKKLADDQIAARAIDVIRWRVGLPENRIQLKVEKGMVTLSGEVDYQFQKHDAQAAVHNLTGVTAVINELRVASPLQVSQVKDKIENALRRSAELDASQITVQVDGGKVTLGGKVRAWFERGLAEQAAWAAPGVTEVSDHIQVEP